MKIFRTIYYIDVGDLPKQKAEAYMKKIVEEYRVHQLPHEQTIAFPTRENGRVEVQMLPVDETDRYIDTQTYAMPRAHIEKVLNEAAAQYALHGGSA